MGVTNIEHSARTVALLMNDGAKTGQVNICKVNTGSYIYEAYMRIYGGNNKDVYVIKKNNKNQEVARTSVMIAYGTAVCVNKSGNITIPVSVQKKLCEFDRALTLCIIDINRTERYLKGLS